ncbi:hypothetical protein ET524_09700 [Senegalimassilia faecalis]|uniref:Type II toxin-antitoxin system RelE/ParE family toxin n=1 Tax=Senegalimassilia faecalis TaxID=2509433 RepID=A0A4Q2K530_9ACTN|nr:type II toxin-antitoxin system RelE/ParE family toxin [Senegalimassilia faecalis]RXZ54724.1 hypothetical protein ET524_09700 [Senegalimassilia faecalis]
MACSVEIADEARVGLENAVAYIVAVLHEPSAGTKLLDAFDEFVDTVSELPDLCPLCAEERLAAQGIRKTLVEGYVALYLRKHGTVFVIGFFHQTQDYAKLV